jgi:ferric-dicitrate binding protein FerR (iron transport regulator)
MSLPTSQQRALNRIEKALADDHPSLGPMFAIFTTLVDDEAMPVTERVTARAWRSRRRRVWPAVATLVGLAMAAAALFTVSAMLPSPQVCPGTFTAVAAHTQPAPTGRLLACTTRQNRLGTP